MAWPDASSSSRKKTTRNTKLLLESLKPVGALEEQFAQTIVEQNWRLSRLLTIEDILLHTGKDAHVTGGDPEINAALAAAQAFRDDGKAFLNLSVYEQRIHRILEKALKQLRELQDERRFAERRDLPQAVRRYNQQKKQDKPYDPQADGFVCSLAQVEREIAARQPIGDRASGDRVPILS